MERLELGLVFQLVHRIDTVYYTDQSLDQSTSS